MTTGNSGMSMPPQIRNKLEKFSPPQKSCNYKFRKQYESGIWRSKVVQDLKARTDLNDNIFQLACLTENESKATEVK